MSERTKMSFTMKSINNLINFLIGTLFITHIWIILFLNAIDFFFFSFHPKLHKVVYGNPFPSPEPYEILLYFSLSTIFVFAIWFFFRFIRRLLTLIPLIVRIVIFLLLLLYLVTKLGTYPLAGDRGYFPLAGYISPYTSIPDNRIYWIIFILYLSFILFITLETKMLQRFVRSFRVYHGLIFATAALIVALLTFEFRFSIPALDAAYFWGPVWEIVHGKTIVTDVPSMYGFLSVLLSVIFYKLTHINFLYLPVFIWILYIVEYTICFYLILKAGKSVPLAFLGLFSLITVNYFGLFHNPQTGPLRWAPLFLGLFLFSKFKTIDSKRLIFSIALLALWNIDSGIALVAAFIFTIFLLFLARKINLHRVFFAGIYLLISFAAIFGLIDLLHILYGRKLIDFFRLYQPLRDSALGILMRPMETYTYFWLFMLIYFASIIYFFKNTKEVNPNNQDTRNKQYSNSKNSIFKQFDNFKFGIWNLFGNWNLEIETSENMLLLFSANLMFFASIYYVGRSIPHNIINLSPFIILTFFLLIGSVYHHLNSTKKRLIGLCIIFFLTIIYPGFARKEYLANELLHKYQKLQEGNFFSSETDKIVKEKYYKEADFIRNNLKETGIIIVSTDDTYLFYLTGKKNFLDVNPIIYINTKSQMDVALKNLGRYCPKKIAVDCQVYKKCPLYKSLTGGWPNILPILLEEVEKKCQVEYNPSKCTDKLCIAESRI